MRSARAVLLQSNGDRARKTHGVRICPSTSSIFLFEFIRTRKVNMGRFPSGQREQTVNLPSTTSVVRIHPCPPKNRLVKASRFFYPLRKHWQSGDGSLIARVKYAKFRCAAVVAPYKTAIGMIYFLGRAHKPRPYKQYHNIL